LAVTYNLEKARGWWAQVSRALTKQHINPKASGFFYKAVVQAVLLYSCETWTVSHQSLSELEGFHNQGAQKLTQQSIHLNPMTGTLVYHLPVETARSTAGLFTIQNYIKK
jgi:hypothetical protein